MTILKEVSVSHFPEVNPFCLPNRSHVRKFSTMKLEEGKIEGTSQINKTEKEKGMRCVLNRLSKCVFYKNNKCLSRLRLCDRIDEYLRSERLSKIHKYSMEDSQE